MACGDLGFATIEDILKKLDPELWKKQRLCLLELSGRFRRAQMARGVEYGTPGPELIQFSKDDDDCMEGLTNFLDAVTDYLADVRGRKEFLIMECEKCLDTGHISNDILCDCEEGKKLAGGG